MNRLPELNNKLNSYYNLKSSIDSIISFFVRSIESIDAAQGIGNQYILNDVSADLGKVQNNKNKLVNKKNHLQQTIIPSIENQIRQTRREIEAETERQRLENEKKIAAKLSGLEL